MITSCPHCNERYQVLRSDLFEGPMRARCANCSTIFPLNDQDASSGIRPLTLPPGTLIKLGQEEDVSRLDQGPEWVGDELMGPLALLATVPPPPLRMSQQAFGTLAPHLSPTYGSDGDGQEATLVFPEPMSLWARLMRWLGVA